MLPQIVGYDAGYQNTHLDKAIDRVVTTGVYKDQSVVIIIPALTTVHTKAASSWWNLIFLPNQRAVKLFAQGMEVGEAYSQTIEAILADPNLSSMKYILTIEADNTVPPDGLLQLVKRMEAHPEFACIGGLYWTKYEGGCPQIWGDPKDPVLNFRPQVPVSGELVECNGTGMGFNLWRMEMFKDERLRRPWFKTVAGREGVGTQDLYFWGDAKKHGYRCAVDCNVLVGHVDSNGFVW